MKRFIFNSTLITTLLAAATCVGISAGHAETFSQDCVQHDKIGPNLERGYGEILLSQMLESRQGMLAELYINIDTGSWTMVFTNPQKIACVVGSGTNFEFGTIVPINEQDLEF